MRFYLGGPRIAGIRPGISFGPEDFKQKRGSPPRKPAGDITGGSFVYVLKGDHNLVKIGVTTNPSARLASIRTGSPFPLDYAFLGITPGPGFDIEQASHAMLTKQRLEGEWFDVSTELATASVMSAAAKLGQPLKPIDLATADLALKLTAAGFDPDKDNLLSSPSRTLGKSLIRYFIVYPLLLCGILFVIVTIAVVVKGDGPTAAPPPMPSR